MLSEALQGKASREARGHIEKPSSVDRYEVLDSLRGFAAIAVVLFHGRQTFGDLLPGGYLAVDFFFMLSGFVMHHAYGRQLDGGLTARRFMIKRVQRLYPVYALGVFLAVILAIAAGRFSTGTFAAAVVGITGLPFPPVAFNFTLYPINGPAWSLLYELIANLLMVLFWVRLTRLSLIFVCALGAMALATLSPGLGSLDYGLRWTDAPIGISRIMFSFSAGLLIYRFGRGFAVSAWVGYCLPVVLISMLALPASARWQLDIAIVCIVFPAILVLGAAAAKPCRITQRLWSIMGLASFPLYMIHKPILDFLPDNAPVLQSGFAGCLVAIALAGLAYGVAVSFDLPIQHLIKNWRSDGASHKGSAP